MSHTAIAARFVSQAWSRKNGKGHSNKNGRERESEREEEKGKCSLRWKAKCIGSGGSRVYEVTVPVRNKGL